MDYKDIQNDFLESTGHSLVDRAETSILDLFSKNNYGVGDLIPKEMELATQLGVSRTVVREAVSRLRMRGWRRP